MYYNGETEENHENPQSHLRFEQNATRT